MLSPVLQPRTALCNVSGLGSCAFARHYLRNHFCFLFLRVLRCFSSPGSLRSLNGDTIARAGLPHSEIRESMSICLSSRLIAAYHVLLRLQEPRHPSCALFSFLFSFRRRIYLACLSKHGGYSGKNCIMKFDLLVESYFFSSRCATRSEADSICLSLQYVNVLVLAASLKPYSVVPGRVELPTSTLSV